MNKGNDWNESKKVLPPIGEVIEGITPRDWLYSKLERDYFALVKINNELIWITPGLTDMDFTELKITHWRFILPDHKGRKPFVRIIKSKNCWEPKIIFKRVN